MTSSKRTLMQLLLLTMLLASCGAQPTAEATMDVNAIMTEGVGTFVAALTQTQAVVVLSQTATASPTSTFTATPTLSTNTPAATSTQAFLPVFPSVFLSATPTGTQYTPTVNPSTLGSGCNNLRLISDVSIPSGTAMQPGEEFTKTWKVENNGTCDWVYLFRLVFVSGERMEGVPSGLGKVISPGKWTQLSLGLKAPSKPGTYTGNWRLGNQSGSPFGSTLTVSIVVANPTNTPVPPTNTPVTPTNTPETPSYPNP